MAFPTWGEVLGSEKGDVLEGLQGLQCWIIITSLEWNAFNSRLCESSKVQAKERYFLNIHLKLGTSSSSSRSSPDAFIRPCATF